MHNGLPRPLLTSGSASPAAASPPSDASRLPLGAPLPPSSGGPLGARGVVRLEEVRRGAGREVEVRPGSPKVRYEVNTRKRANVVQIPETRTTVFDFFRREWGVGQEAPLGRAPGLRQQS